MLQRITNGVSYISKQKGRNLAVIEQYQQTIDKLDRDIASITDFTADDKKIVTDYMTVLKDIYSKYSKLKG